MSRSSESALRKHAIHHEQTRMNTLVPLPPLYVQSLLSPRASADCLWMLYKLFASSNPMELGEIVTKNALALWTGIYF